MDDKSTIKAIDTLAKDFPYAAAVFTYIHIERLLKNYVLKHRNTGGQFNYDKKVHVERNKKCVNDFKGHKKNDFIEGFLSKIELGKLEHIFGIQGEGISERRNNLMHSNKYIAFENLKSIGQRADINKKYVVEAKKDLKYIQNRIKYK